MVPFIFGCALGGFTGVLVMCLFQINKPSDKEEKADGISEWVHLGRSGPNTYFYHASHLPHSRNFKFTLTGVIRV